LPDIIGEWKFNIERIAYRMGIHTEQARNLALHYPVIFQRERINPCPEGTRAAKRRGSIPIHFQLMG
jgi:hypothetical protein